MRTEVCRKGRKEGKKKESERKRREIIEGGETFKEVILEDKKENMKIIDTKWKRREEKE